MSEMERSFSILAFLSSCILTVAGRYSLRKKQNAVTNDISLPLSSYSPRCGDQSTTYEQLIGNTPLVKLQKLSELCRCSIYAKMESRNPAGTGKDRAVQYMLEEAKKHPNYRPGVPIVEGTSGSTGIALALQCRALALPVHLVMPDDQAAEKTQLLEKLGANVLIVKCCSISNRNHYVHTARRLAEQLGGIFINQFENTANFRAHYETTGPELWHQLSSRIKNYAEQSDECVATILPPLDAFVMGAGTGGTIAGVSRFLKEQCDKINSYYRSNTDPTVTRAEVKVVLADPTGSSLQQKVKYGVCYTAQQAERQMRRHRYDSIVEGVGLDRITRNFDNAVINEAFTISDQQVLNMAHWLLQHEGLFVGSSSAMNIAAAVKTAVQLSCTEKEQDSQKSPPVVVTVICDEGYRHISRFWNAAYVTNYHLHWPSTVLDSSSGTLPTGRDDPLIQSLFKDS